MPLINEMRKQMREATRVLMTGTASATLQKALNEIPAMRSTLPSMPDFMRNLPHDSVAGKGFAADPAVPDFVKNLLGQLGVVGTEPGQASAADFRPPWPTARTMPARDNTADTTDESHCNGHSAGHSKGQFLSKSLTNQAGTREYKLYIPGCYSGQPLPLVVMLHGCTQNPDDFANGTRMNLLAEEKQCFVVYPAQTHAANSSKCWTWFKSLDQQRGQGEPSIIADITREVMATYRLDGSKVYVAGLSAGGAMAVIMGTTYPELYAAVGVHSGLPFGSATDLPSALAAMRGGVPKPSPRSADTSRAPVPIIIFHGDSDTTVHMKNGERLMKQNSPQNPDVLIGQGQVPNGHRYTCTSHHDAGQLLAEHWLIHGAGHAWAGGCQSGSYTDPKGPDATREMLRFFYAQSKPAPHA